MMTKLSEETKQEMLGLMRRFKREKFQPSISYEGITPSESNVIFGILMASKHGVDPVQPRDVSKWLLLTPSALSQTLKVLEEKGFVKRERICGDSRAVSLELTEKGFVVAHEIFRSCDNFMDGLAEYVGEEDIKHLIETFKKVLSFLTEQTKAGAIRREVDGFHHISCMGHGVEKSEADNKSFLNTEEDIEEENTCE